MTGLQGRKDVDPLIAEVAYILCRQQRDQLVQQTFITEYMALQNPKSEEDQLH